ncbi:metal ABC transporter solute-binding protein, Zn/Mn family [Companilactobacillus ginsenosidimutans]|uniref:Zinc ABC transporter substrate-binding protein n=1 Tax=Companilactobacillus ginsenosidimutans TaxID=1007676 RepID=A0A0H4R213_9LACO|nr:zinc ABC transporter substrate-binding protein [Companilactobacillus ginsenosidimutans]AKP67775.1 zinc ABC transporter substrate-binding protein [Companilactobacillus ginsenosidimutans]
MSRKKYFLTFIVLFMLILTGCAKNNSQKNIITTTVNTYNEPVKAIVGNRYKVESIIKSVNVDPHSFSPSTNNSKQIADSKLIVANGLGYDDWVNKMVEANSQQKNLIDFANVLGKNDGANEHIWYGVDHMKKLAKAVYQHMARVDVNSKNYYYDNYTKYLRKLDKLSDREKSIKKYSQGKVAYVTEPLPDYLLHDIGVKVGDYHFAKAIEDDTDPSMKDVRNLENGMREHKVDFLVVNKQVTSSIITKMINTANENNIPVVYFTETLPSDLGYYDWMNGNLNQIEKVVKE